MSLEICITNLPRKTLLTCSQNLLVWSGTKYVIFNLNCILKNKTGAGFKPATRDC